MTGSEREPAPGGPIVQVLELGGSHVGAARVDRARPAIAGEVVVRALDAGATAETILDQVAGCAALIRATSADGWRVAIPGPFDYATGVGAYRDVGKFDALRGVDIRVGLAMRLGVDPGSIWFVNDADAFLLGEAAIGAARGYPRAVGITLGTGVGSAWLADGRLVRDGPAVPPGGEAHRLTVRGMPLEHWVSSRAIAARDRAVRDHGSRATGGPADDVASIASRARGGDATARAVIEESMGLLGQALGPWISRFGASVVVVGGAIARSWDVVGPPLVLGMRAVGGATVPVEPSRIAHPALLGAATMGTSDLYGVDSAVPRP